ncbi:MAG TPA: hypothetical protein VGG23_03380, partial [Acidimicrobiales bacterium]
MIDPVVTGAVVFVVGPECGWVRVVVVAVVVVVLVGDGSGLVWMLAKVLAGTPDVDAANVDFDPPQPAT